MSKSMLSNCAIVPQENCIPEVPRNCVAQVYDPYSPKSLTESLSEMKRVDSEDRTSVRASLAKECGFTGLSLLHRLHALYGFDVIRDLVLDAMNNIALNVTSHHLHFYLDEGITSPKDIEERLQLMPWTPGKASFLLTASNNYLYIIMQSLTMEGFLLE